MPKVFVPVILVLLYAGTCADEDFNTGVNYIRYNECLEFGAGDYVCFDSVITDSRCPVDVVCFWEGEAIAGFIVSTNEGSHYIQMKVGEDTVVGDYRVKFDDLLPYPNTKVEVNTEDYSARVVIEN